MTTRRRILVIQGHPDARERHFCDALAGRYREAASSASHELRLLEIAQLDLPLLRSKQDWSKVPCQRVSAKHKQALPWGRAPGAGFSPPRRPRRVATQKADP
jgi:putative NADPH-quinone reductase